MASRSCFERVFNTPELLAAILRVRRSSASIEEVARLEMVSQNFTSTLQTVVWSKQRQLVVGCYNEPSIHTDSFNLELANYADYRKFEWLLSRARWLERLDQEGHGPHAVQSHVLLSSLRRLSEPIYNSQLAFTSITLRSEFFCVQPNLLSRSSQTLKRLELMGCSSGSASVDHRSCCLIDYGTFLDQLAACTRLDEIFILKLVLKSNGSKKTDFDNQLGECIGRLTELREIKFGVFEIRCALGRFDPTEALFSSNSAPFCLPHLDSLELASSHLVAWSAHTLSALHIRCPSLTELSIVDSHSSFVSFSPSGSPSLLTANNCLWTYIDCWISLSDQAGRLRIILEVYGRSTKGDGPRLANAIRDCLASDSVSVCLMPSQVPRFIEVAIESHDRLVRLGVRFI